MIELNIYYSGQGMSSDPPKEMPNFKEEMTTSNQLLLDMTTSNQMLLDPLNFTM